jgi:hypothetical protein
MAQTKAQAAAQKRYDANNKEKRNYLRARSATRSFIRNKATAEDIDELQSLLDERRNELED